MPRRSDVASLIIQADMWTGKHVPNIWKQKDQTDYSSDQARGRCEVLQRAARRMAEQSPTRPDVHRARCPGRQGVNACVKG